MTRVTLTLILGLLVASPVFASGPTPGAVRDHATQDGKRAARHMKKDATRAWKNPSPRSAYRGMKKNTKQAHRHLVNHAKKKGFAGSLRLRKANRVVKKDAKRANKRVKTQSSKARSGNYSKRQIDRAIRRDGRRADKRFKKYGRVSGLNKSPRVRKGYRGGKGRTTRGYRKARRRAR